MKVDLRSDTVTRPTEPMRAAIASAAVGDDSWGDDPTVNALQERTAELLGKESAVFFPTGIMANETALQLIARPGTEVIVEAHSHFVDWELGAPAMIGGFQLRPVAAPDHELTADLVESAIRLPLRHQLRTSAVSIENTHSISGGRLLPIQNAREIADVARRHGLGLHLDGARLWNAAVATGLSERILAEPADTVMVTLSKGLGCPVGSLLAGRADDMERGRVIRRRMGGAMRQAGVLAAAGLYALEHHRTRLADDHRRAAELADRIQRIPGIDVVPPQTNILIIDLDRDDIDAMELTRALSQRGVGIAEITARRVRAVTHLDVDDEGIELAANAFEEVLAG